LTPRSWIRVGLVFALLSAVTSGATPWLHALGGAFRAPDFAADVAGARLMLAGANPYSSAFAATHGDVLGAGAGQGYPYLPHPPFAIALALPFGHGPLEAAASAWFVLSLILLFILAALLREEATRTTTLPSVPLGVWFGLLLLWPPTLYNLEKGQFSILLALLTTAAWRAWLGGRSRLAALCIGAAASVKVVPILLGGWLLVRARSSLAWLAATGGVLTAISLLPLGWDAIPGYVEHTRANLSYWETWPAVTFSLHSLFARLLVGGQWATALIVQPAFARVLSTVIALTLVALALRHSWRTRASDDASISYALWVTLLVVLNPLSMGHNGVLLALPLVIAARTVLSQPSTLLKVGWVVAMGLIALPRQTLLSLAPVPVSPLAGVTVLALPLWGTLLLFAALLACRPAPAFARNA